MIYVLRLLLAIANGRESEATHERAHVACETAVYAVVAPDAPDDATTPAGELIASILCRADGAT